MAENNKLTSLGQLRKLAERALLDSQSRISEVLELMIPLLESAQHTGITSLCRPRTGTAELRLCRTSPS